MAAVFLYASDHGFGHATRLLVLARALVDAGHRVELAAGPAAAAVLATPALPVRPLRLDFGVCPRADGVGVDAGATAARLAGWLRELPALVEREAAFLRDRGADLVLVDAPAAACAAAAAAGVPAVLCSNFLWSDVYGDRFGAEVLAVLRAAYGAARLGLRLGIGRLPLDGVARVREIGGVLGRAPTRARAAVRAELGLCEDVTVIGLGLGRSHGPAQTAALLAGLGGSDGDLRVLVPEDNRPAGTEARVVAFPAGARDAQDYLAASDLVLAKGGYSTIAEAALAGVPLCLFPVTDNAESAALCRDAEALGLGFAYPDEAHLRAALADPSLLLGRARALPPRPPVSMAAPQILAALRDEGLL